MKRLIIMLAIAMCFAGVAWGGTPGHKFDVGDTVTINPGNGITQKREPCTILKVIDSKGRYDVACDKEDFYDPLYCTEDQLEHYNVAYATSSGTTLLITTDYDNMLTLDDVSASSDVVIDGDVEINGNLILPDNRSLVFSDGTYQWSVEADEEKGVDMMAIWEFGFTMWLYATGALFFSLLLAEIGLMSYRWVNDDETKGGVCDKLGFENILRADGKKAAIILRVLLIGFFMAIAGFAWPISIAAISIYAALFGTRAFIRFKKKVHSALSMKSDKGHTHPEDVED